MSFAGHSDRVRGLAIHPGRHQLLTASYDHTLRLWDIASGAVIRIFEGHHAAVIRCRFSPDGESIVSGCLEGIVRLSKGEDSYVLGKNTAAITGLAFCPQGVVSASKDGQLISWPLAEGEESQSQSIDATVESIEACEGGLIVGDGEGNVRVYDLCAFNAPPDDEP